MADNWELPTGELLSEWAEERKRLLDGRPVILSVSGGKDSTAAGLLLKAAGIPFLAVHSYTGWEHEETEKYLAGPLPDALGVPITILRNPKHPNGMRDLVKNKGMFPSRVLRFCTQELKIEPLKALLEQYDDEPVHAIGVRKAESRARSTLTEWDDSTGLDALVWRPLAEWTYDDVIDIHKRYGVTPNSLYLTHGQERVGCWPCIFARKKEIRAVAELTPERIDLIEEMEHQAYADYLERCKKRGEEPKLTQENYAWFRNPYRRYGSRDNSDTQPKVLAIRKVVEWSKTDRSGNEALAPDYAAEGCMRWGMCDHGGNDTPTDGGDA